MPTKKFPKSVLREVLMMGEEDAEPYEGCTFVDTEETGESRWSTHHELIFRHDDKLWSADYTQGKSETQDEYPFEYAPDEVECTEVEKVVEFVKKVMYKVVK